MTELFARQILVAAAYSDEPIDVNEKENVPIKCRCKVQAITSTTTGGSIVFRDIVITAVFYPS